MTRVSYRPYEQMVADIVRDLRLASPEPNGFRSWRSRLMKETGWGEDRHFGTIRRWELGEAGQIEVGYVTACALVSGVEIVVGANPRLIQSGVEGQARDLLDRLRAVAMTGRRPPLGMEDVHEMHQRIDWGLLRKVDGAA